MANPNILTSTSVTGVSAVSSALASSPNDIFGAVPSGKVWRVINLTAVNITSNAPTITVSIGAAGHTQGSGTTVLYQQSVAANSSFDAVDKDKPLYLQENQVVRATTNTASSLNLLITYEEIT